MIALRYSGATANYFLFCHRIHGNKELLSFLFLPLNYNVLEWRHENIVIRSFLGPASLFKSAASEPLAVKLISFCVK